MNFDKRHNVFSDIPGIDASKGERIVKALQRLWEKIEHLEQIRNFERNSKSKEELSSSVDEDPTISDVRFKLLILQLQYVRSVLRKRGGGRPETISQETQTGGSLIGGRSLPSEYARVFATEGPPPPNTTKTGEPKTHYHLKLDDVPFLLGKSSGVSHSVVANMQYAIALMKTHNKGLCGRPTREQPKASETPMLNRLTRELERDLHHLSRKQEGLAKRMDAVEIGQKKCDRRKKMDLLRCRSTSESSALPASERKPAAPPANEKAGRSNPPIAARRHFLRSLQNFKSHLSEEDISWN